MVLKRIFFVLANFIIIPITFFACAQVPGSGRGNMMGYSCGGGSMWLIVLVLVGAVIYFMLKSPKSKDSNNSLIETPLDVLKKRYANGEINKEEFDRMKNDLES